MDNQKPAPEPSPEINESEKNPGWITSFILTMMALIFLRWLVGRTDNYEHQILILCAGSSTLLLVPILRQALLRALIASTLIASGIFFINNSKAIINGKISAPKAATGIIKIISGFGPIQEAQKIGDTFKYEKYLKKVDHRSPEINQIATQITKGCGSTDQYCVASKIVDYVTSELEYREDPLPTRSNPDYVKTPQETLISKAGDCDDLTVLTSSLLGTVGVLNYMVFEKDHTYPLACFQDRKSIGNSIKLGEKYCYAIEPTKPKSKIGEKKNFHNTVIFDPFTGKRVSASK